MTAPPPSRVLGVIGGSGMYEALNLERVTAHRVDTPFGAPSDAVAEGYLGATKVLFLPRHGRGHVHAPHRVNYRANVCALKRLGATQLLSLSAVGSMREDIAPGDVVVVDQYIDLTRCRPATFFEDGIAAHVGMADPVCPDLAAAASAAAKHAGGRVHEGGTYVCIDGPQFSTRAESLLYRSWGVSVIGMTAMPEAKLAREAELPYATIAFATDYDCWHEDKDAVSVETIVAVLRKNADLAMRIVVEVSKDLPDPSRSPASSALRHSIITPKSQVSPEVRARLTWLLAPYIEEDGT